MTPFQKEVYEAVKKIPPGETWTYQEIARAIKRPRAYRAVGNALNKNRDPQVPCHRVIRSDGQIGGFYYGPEKKKKLLEKEARF